ncbi:MAG: pyridoxamine 5'-phosphate oxidase family protein [Rhodospirillaceae bacterium]|jgi:predicted pyridoxine 5'-phosphate oxidase superfamily flavin-nucleotide-binding protein|nr:pyridoxamine 5'-phosphate oxidase family protein [Rhodospirillaceae bacterium]MBT5459889.1 pyridoxamine 5'-phosphate oxidase family protein [Rhodospirillaceae bacterium]
MAFSQQIKDLIFNAHKDDCVCMLATIGDLGPNISPKGSMIVLDDDHLAYWERAKRGSLDNLRDNPRVAVVYSNKAAAERGEIDHPGGIFRFFGTAEIHERGDYRDRIRTLLQEREINHDGAEEGFAVVITLDRAENLRGVSLR